MQELLELNLIELSNVAIISHPIMYITKKYIISVCIDYRALNSATQAQTFPMKDSREIMCTAGAAKYLCLIWMTF